MLVIAGDNVLDFSLTKFMDYARAKNTSCIMRYFEAEEKKLQKLRAKKRKALEDQARQIAKDAETLEKYRQKYEQKKQKAESRTKSKEKDAAEP